MTLRLPGFARRIARQPRGLRRRMTVLLLAGVCLASLGFEALLVTLTWHSEHQQLEARARSIARLMAQRALPALAAGDVAELSLGLHRAVVEPDVLGAAVYPARGRMLAERNLDRPLWPELGAPDRYPDGDEVAVSYRRTSAGTVLDVTAPILARPGGTRAAPAPAGRERAAGPPAAARPRVGWMRVAFSTVRVEQAVQNAAQLGLLLNLAIPKAIGAFEEALAE